MSVLIGGKNFILNVPIGSGGEGEIFKLDSQEAVKIYYPTVICDKRRLKVLALCNSYANNIDQLGTESFAFPKLPAYKSKEKLDSICGFSMQFFEDCPKLDDIGYDLSSSQFGNSKSVRIDDDKAVQFIYNTFNVVDRLHKLRIILGDVNPSNLLYNKTSNYPIIIDIDSAQVGRFQCLSWSEEYLDPLIQEQGKNIQGGYTYSYESDIFSIACVCFEFIVGANPFFVLTDPPNDNKANGISLLRYIHTNTNVVNGVKYLSNPVNENIKSRINFLKANYPKLYDFFISIFLDSHRINLMQTLDRRDSRHPAYLFYKVYSQSGFDNILETLIRERQKPKVVQSLPISPAVVGTFAIPDSGFLQILSVPSVSQVSSTQPVIAQIKVSDPDELLPFLKNYGVDITDLMVGVSC